MILFLDLEATGTDPDRHCILEVGAVLTDDQFGVLAEVEQLVKPIGHPLPGFDFTKLDPAVVEMHTKNGLFADVMEHGLRRYEAEEKLLEWCYEHDLFNVTLAGNSVWFDYIFIKKHMPRLASYFDRRVIDISSLNQLAKRYQKKAYNTRPKEDGLHRALPDALSSRDTLVHYYKKGVF